MLCKLYDQLPKLRFIGELKTDIHDDKVATLAASIECSELDLPADVV